MLGYAAKRIALAAAVVALVMAIVFTLIYAIPGDPARVALGPLASPALIDELRARMGLDQPLPLQILHFYKSVLMGDLGRDVLSNESVLRIILTVMPNTSG
jgi:peptide/nickel transport system permease protein